MNLIRSVVSVPPSHFKIGADPYAFKFQYVHTGSMLE
jgi:hypothetical protein